MKILILLSLVLFVVSIIFFIEYLKVKRKYKFSQRDVKRLIKTIERVRYGQLDARVKSLNNTNLQWAANRLIESLEDREKMISEYQKDLFKKNESLEKLILNEKESQRFKEDFIATLTHDMKTPIIAELNTLDFLIEGRFGELNEKQKEAINLMKTSNTELIELAEILLETYKVQQSSIVLKKKKVNVNELIFEIIEEMTPIAQHTNQKISFECDNNQIELQIDAFQIKRVLKNLILNALSFSVNHSSVDVALFKDGPLIKITVTNLGQGISQEDLLLIFNKYYSSVKKFRKIGTGLGLYLANQIVKAHKGTISVNSIENDKTTFEIELPVD